MHKVLSREGFRLFGEWLAHSRRTCRRGRSSRREGTPYLRSARKEQEIMTTWLSTAGRQAGGQAGEAVSQSGRQVGRK